MFKITDSEPREDIPFTSLVFPGGEEHITLLGRDFQGREIHIEANIWSSKDVMTLLMLTDAVRHSGAGKVILLMKYVPYARQDRVANSGEALSIKVFCNLINSQKYDQVIIWDPHSEVTSALLDRVVVIHQHELFRDTVKGPTVRPNTAVIVAPDAGAVKKASMLSVYYQTPMITASKHRDTMTGQITGTTVDSGHVGDKDFWIVDDICDGGRTFTELAKVLKPLTTGRIMLYVTHGIFSKGLSVFNGLIDAIYCANLRGPVAPCQAVAGKTSLFLGNYNVTLEVSPTPSN